jgi:hypothetical protein
MFRLCPPDGHAGHCIIERNETPAMPHCERKQIDIGNLSRTMDARGIHGAFVEQAQVIRPEFMQRVFARFAKPFSHRHYGKGIRVTRMRHDSYASVLGDWTRRPTVSSVVGKPIAGTPVQRVIGVEQRNQDVDVEQRSHQ